MDRAPLEDQRGAAARPVTEHTGCGHCVRSCCCSWVPRPQPPDAPRWPSSTAKNILDFAPPAPFHLTYAHHIPASLSTSAPWLLGEKSPTPDPEPRPDGFCRVPAETSPPSPCIPPGMESLLPPQQPLPLACSDLASAHYTKELSVLPWSRPWHPTRCVSSWTEEPLGPLGPLGCAAVPCPLPVQAQAERDFPTDTRSRPRSTRRHQGFNFYTRWLGCQMPHAYPSGVTPEGCAVDPRLGPGSVGEGNGISISDVCQTP